MDSKYIISVQHSSIEKEGLTRWRIMVSVEATEAHSSRA